MGHDQRDCLKDYWSREEQYFTPFYSNMMVHERFFQILIFLHFVNNDNPPNRDDLHYDRLWKIRNIFDILNNKFYELYNPTEHLAIDEVIVLFKGRVIFWQYLRNTSDLASKFINCATLLATHMTCPSI